MLKITISGHPGEGKTTLASEIGALLQSLGMATTIVDYDLHYNRSDEAHQAGVEALSGREVLIETVQLIK